MKVICDREALLEAVNLASRAVASRTPRPQLTCLLLSADDSDSAHLSISATDGDVSMRLAATQVEVQQPGRCLIPADKVKQIVQAEDNEPTLTITTEDEAAEIRGADAFFKVFGYPAGDFPVSAELEESADGGFTMHSDDLLQLISRTTFSTARETSRYAINGVLLRRVGKRIEMVATDGRRLALARTQAETVPNDDEESCIVPTKALNVLGQLLPSVNGEVRLVIEENRAVFSLTRGGDPVPTVLASNLVEGTFPPYEDVIPKDGDKKATFEIGMLASAVRRAALLTNEESRGVMMRFSNDDQQLTLSSRAPEMGEAEIQVGMSEYDGEDIEIGFNPRFITEALKVLDSESVMIEMKAPAKPGVIRAGSDFLYVVMPVNMS